MSTTRTSAIDIPIQDFSTASINAYKAAGYKAIAHYSDGTEKEVDWSTVKDPTPDPAKSVFEAASKATEAIANAINQHFFTDGSGVHVTQDSSSPDTQHNILINSGGILLRIGKMVLSALSSAGVTIYDGKGNAASNVRATFGSSGVVIGSQSDTHSSVTSDGFTVYDGSGTKTAHISTSECSIGSTNRVVISASPSEKSSAYSTALKMIAHSSSNNTDAEVFEISCANIPTLPAEATASVRIGVPNAGHTTMDSGGMTVYNGSTALASYRSTLARIGTDDGNHVDIDSNGMRIAKGSGVNAVVYANYSGDTIMLGESSKAAVKFCGGGAEISYWSNGSGDRMYLSAPDSVGIGAGHTEAESSSLWCNQDGTLSANFRGLTIFGMNAKGDYSAGTVMSLLSQTPIKIGVKQVESGANVSAYRIGNVVFFQYAFNIGAHSAWEDVTLASGLPTTSQATRKFPVAAQGGAWKGICTSVYPDGTVHLEMKGDSFSNGSWIFASGSYFADKFSV